MHFVPNREVPRYVCEVTVILRHHSICGQNDLTPALSCCKKSILSTKSVEEPDLVEHVSVSLEQVSRSMAENGMLTLKHPQMESSLCQLLSVVVGTTINACRQSHSGNGYIRLLSSDVAVLPITADKKAAI